MIIVFGKSLQMSALLIAIAAEIGAVRGNS